MITEKMIIATALDLMQILNSRGVEAVITVGGNQVAPVTADELVRARAFCDAECTSPVIEIHFQQEGKK